MNNLASKLIKNCENMPDKICLIQKDTKITYSELYNMVSNNRIVIMQLADSTAKSDWEKQRYVIICGVDKTSHSLKVYDCLKTSDKLLEWVKTTKVFDGGYDSANVNVKFSGSIIEVTN